MDQGLTEIKGELRSAIGERTRNSEAVYAPTFGRAVALTDGGGLGEGQPVEYDIGDEDIYYSPNAFDVDVSMGARPSDLNLAVVSLDLADPGTLAWSGPAALAPFYEGSNSERRGDELFIVGILAGVIGNVLVASASGTYRKLLDR